MCEIFRTFRFSRFLHVSFLKSSTFRFAGFTGNYCYDNKAIKILHEDISDEWETFSTSILGKVNSLFSPDMEGALKRVQREYDPNAPYANWMRMKSFCLTAETDDNFLLEENLAQRVAELFKTTKPFIDYINRAVDYVKEEMEG